MNAEYKRLEAEAREVDRQIQELTETHVVSAAEHARIERKLSEHHIRLRSLRHGMLLIRSLNSVRCAKPSADLSQPCLTSFIHRESAARP